MAQLMGTSTADIPQLLAWHCLQQRHGVVVHVVVIVLDDLLLQFNVNEYAVKQPVLTALKIELLPLLYAGAGFSYSSCGCLVLHY